MHDKGEGVMLLLRCYRGCCSVIIAAVVITAVIIVAVIIVAVIGYYCCCSIDNMYICTHTQIL